MDGDGETWGPSGAESREDAATGSGMLRAPRVWAAEGTGWRSAGEMVV